MAPPPTIEEKINIALGGVALAPLQINCTVDSTGHLNCEKSQLPTVDGYTKKSPSRQPPTGHPGNRLFSSPKPPADVSPLDKALHEAETAHANGNFLLFQYAKMKATVLASVLPNGGLLAVPMVKADLSAIKGDYVGAAKQYGQLAASLEVIAPNDSSIKPHIAAVRQRQRGVLAVGAATAVVQFNQMNTFGDEAVALQKQATDCADQLYLMDSSEENIQRLLATYSQVGLDVRAMRAKLAQNQSRITGLEWGMFNPWIKPLIQATESHVLALVQHAHADSPFYASIQSATAHLIMGNQPASLKSLQAARKIYENAKIEPNTENKFSYVTVLHRIVGVAGTQSELKEEALIQALSVIDDLVETDPKPALLLRFENMELLGQVRIDRAALALRSSSLSEVERKQALDTYQEASLKKHQDIRSYSKTLLQSMKDKETRALLIDRMAKAEAGVFECKLDHDLNIYTEGQEDLGKGYAKADSDGFQRRMAEIQRLAPGQNLSEAMGRGLLAQANFEFRTGRIAESITHLRSLVNEHPNSSATGIVLSHGGWPHQYKIITDEGQFNPEIGTKSWTAGAKEIAGKLNDKPGRAGLASTGGAAAGWAVGMLVAPEVTGTLLIVGGLTGFLVDRSVLIAENRSRISAAYRTGITTITTEEATREAGIFALQLFSMYVGGAVGGVAQRGILAGGTGLARSLAMRGITGTPWLRSVGAFALREASYMGNAYAFHHTSNATTQSVGKVVGLDIPPLDSSHNDDVFSSWLFVRGFAKAMEMNPGGKMIPGRSRGAKWGQGAINMGVGLGIVHTAKAVRDGDMGHLSADNLARSAFDLMAMHHGNRALGSVIPMKTIEKMSRDLDAITQRNIIEARRLVELLGNLAPVLMVGLPVRPLGLDDAGQTDPAPPLHLQNGSYNNVMNGARKYGVPMYNRAENKVLVYQAATETRDLEVLPEFRRTKNYITALTVSGDRQGLHRELDVVQDIYRTADRDARQLIEGRLRGINGEKNPKDISRRLKSLIAKYGVLVGVISLEDPMAPQAPAVQPPPGPVEAGRIGKDLGGMNRYLTNARNLDLRAFEGDPYLKYYREQLEGLQRGVDEANLLDRELTATNPASPDYGVKMERLRFLTQWGGKRMRVLSEGYTNLKGMAEFRGQHHTGQKPPQDPKVAPSSEMADTGVDTEVDTVRQPHQPRVPQQTPPLLYNHLSVKDKLSSVYGMLSELNLLVPRSRDEAVRNASKRLEALNDKIDLQRPETYSPEVLKELDLLYGEFLRLVGEMNELKRPLGAGPSGLRPSNPASANPSSPRGAEDSFPPQTLRSGGH